MRNSTLSAAALAAGLVAALSSQCALAADSLQGYRIIRIPDGSGGGTCILQTDKVTATLRRVVFEKKSKWFGLIQDKSVDLTFTLTLKGSDSNAEGKSASFAKVISEPVNQYGSGQISFAEEQGLLNQFYLTDKNSNVFNQINIEIGVVRTEGKSVAAQILTNAVATTKDLPLPSNPYSSIYNAATTYVNSIFEPVLQQSIDDKEAVTHHIVMNINAANCGSDDERTGTIAVIDQANDSTQPGFIDISDIDNDKYCFSAELSPSFAVKYANKPASNDCRDATSFTEIQNSYLGIVINAATTQPLPGQTPPQHAEAFMIGSIGAHRTNNQNLKPWINSKQSDAYYAKKFHVSLRTIHLYRESMRRCYAHGISTTSCV